MRAAVQVLDLESNSVRDAEQAFQLGTCPRLWSLTLTANPVCQDRHYRRMIVEAVPQLACLDDEDITGDVVVLFVVAVAAAAAAAAAAAVVANQ